MTEHGWIEIASILLGGACGVMVLRVGLQRGIGPQIRMALALCLICPLILILAMEHFLEKETLAATIGALIGLGIPSGGATSGSSGQDSK
jgi:hypothetical protein